MRKRSGWRKKEGNGEEEITKRGRESKMEKEEETKIT